MVKYLLQKHGSIANNYAIDPCFFRIGAEEHRILTSVS